MPWWKKRSERGKRSILRENIDGSTKIKHGEEPFDEVPPRFELVILAAG